MNNAAAKTGYEHDPTSFMEQEEGVSEIDITEAERGAVIDWLHRRSRMCRDAMRWYRPFRRICLRHLAATLRAAAFGIKECAHLARSSEDECEALRRAMVANQRRPPTTGAGVSDG